MRDELNDEEATLLNAILDRVMNEGDQDDARSIVGMFTGQAQFRLSDIEQEHNTWATLERIHKGDVMAVVDAIIEGNWIRNRVIHVPHIGKYFACGWAGHKTEISMNSDFQVTVDYVKRIKQRKRQLKIENNRRRHEAFGGRRNNMNR
jgi:hypothetical protein